MTSRFYGELAEWWPLLSVVEDYEEEADFAAGLLRRAHGDVVDVLELGSGGGNNAYYLCKAFSMTLVDLSPQMVAVSQRLNPQARHHVDDMRTVRLGRTFDAVFVHDAIDYMTSVADLRAAFDTAFAHVRPGGVAVFVPDDVREKFAPSTDHGGHDEPATGRAVRYLAWSWDPDRTDDTVLTEYSFLLREADGRVWSAHDTHVTGLFSVATWVAQLEQAGFEADVVVEHTTEDRMPRTCFVGRRPA